MRLTPAKFLLFDNNMFSKSLMVVGFITSPKLCYTGKLWSKIKRFFSST